MNDKIRIIKSRKNSIVLIYGVSETVKHYIKKQEGGFFCMLLEALALSMLGNMLTPKGIMRAETGYNMDHMDIHF